jgi:hypothetical protein
MESESSIRAPRSLSSGPRGLARAGSRAECAGRYSATATVATIANPYVAATGPPDAVTAAAHPSIAPRTTPMDVRTRSRRTLSASVARNGREKSGSRHAGRGDDADRGDAALAVRHDGERDHERALAPPTSRRTRSAPGGAVRWKARPALPARKRRVDERRGARGDYAGPGRADGGRSARRPSYSSAALARAA